MSARLVEARPEVGRVHHAPRRASRRTRSARREEPAQVGGVDALGAELDPEPEVAGFSSGGVELGGRHRQERRVVADLEEVDVELAGALERTDQAERLGHRVGVLPEERVGSEADHARAVDRASAAASSRTDASAAGSCAKRPRNRPSTAPPSAAAGRGRRPAVDHRAAGATGQRVEGGTERAGDRRDVLGRRGLGGADRPDGLVGDDDAAGRGAVERGVAAARTTVAAAASGRAAVGLADAQHRGDAVAQGRSGLRRDDLVGLAEDPSTLGVADLDDADTELGELGAADLAGERAGRRPEQVLGADEHAACRRSASIAGSDAR